MRVGDIIELVTPRGSLRYRIEQTWIVGPDDVYVLNATDQPTLTLVTCYPFEFVGHAPRRLAPGYEASPASPRRAHA